MACHVIDLRSVFDHKITAAISTDAMMARLIAIKPPHYADQGLLPFVRAAHRRTETGQALVCIQTSARISYSVRPDSGSRQVAS